MKNPERVAALLAELRTLAESDFERHRIDVLERDLHEPPTVEVVDDKHQRFDGVVYSRNIKNRYACSGTIHRAVWGYYNGDIPDGCEIHHIDGDSANNNIENLQILSVAEHHQLHMPKGTQPPKAKRTFICEVCGQEYEAFNVGLNRFCSTKCANKFWHSNRTVTTRVCQWCKQEFETKNPKARFCSRKCIGEAKRTATNIKKTCPICGKEFVTTRSQNYKTCSRECGYKLASLHYQSRR